MVIPSYNNVKDGRYRNNLESILQQDYDNYRIVFIDDASEDGTGAYMWHHVKQRNISPQKLTVIVNKERHMTMPNIHWAAHQFCKPYEIFIIVDGDDELIGKQVFKHINSVYSSTNNWVVYTNFLNSKGYAGYCRPFPKDTVENNSYRTSALVISHLRTFYTKLFTLIKVEDLKDEEGNWFRASNDVAMYIPILEMSHTRVIYVPEISYLYNSNTGLNNHQVKQKEQISNVDKIRAKQSYEGLDKLYTEEEEAEFKASIGKIIPLYRQEEEKYPPEAGEYIKKYQ